MLSTLNLRLGDEINDQRVGEIRQKLLGLGFFRYVLISMKKGSQRNKAKLLIEVEDDVNVLTDWALAGKLGLSQSEVDGKPASSETSPFSYNLSLISRNLFRSLHRGAIGLDLDPDGEFMGGELAYGFPRFAAEDIQFDAYVKAIDSSKRFFEAVGFGAQAAGIWSRSVENGTGNALYGVEMLVNEGRKHKTDGFPRVIAGPLIGYSIETRLRGFIPSSGHAASFKAVVPPGKFGSTLLDLSISKTMRPIEPGATTFNLRVLNVGSSGNAFRLKTDIDIPVVFGRKTAAETAVVFGCFKYARNNTSEGNVVGRSSSFGLRYHSSGFITELAFKVEELPQGEVSP